MIEYLAKPYTSIMTHLKQGDKAPDFSCNDENGILRSLQEYYGKKLIIYFYPKDNTPGCTIQSCNLRDNYEDLKRAGFEIVGVSADGEKKHQNFISKYKLPFTLLADSEKVMLNAYGVWGPKKFMGREYDGIHRITFAIDEQGIISHIIDKVKTKDHTGQIKALYGIE
ncbi:MAG: peroxiredoxin Q/BCP [Vicingaceae bacterium]